MNKAAQQLGRLGGAAKAKKYDHAHYVEIGKKGAAIKYKDKASKKI